MLLSPSLVGPSMSVKQAVLLARRHNSYACLPKACAPVAIAAKLLVLTVAGPRRLLPTSLLSLEGTCSTYRTTRTFSYTANIVICFLSFVNRKIPRRRHSACCRGFSLSVNCVSRSRFLSSRSCRRRRAGRIRTLWCRSSARWSRQARSSSYAVPTRSDRGRPWKALHL